MNLEIRLFIAIKKLVKSHEGFFFNKKSVRLRFL